MYVTKKAWVKAHKIRVEIPIAFIVGKMMSQFKCLWRRIVRSDVWNQCMETVIMQLVAKRNPIKWLIIWSAKRFSLANYKRNKTKQINFQQFKKKMKCQINNNKKLHCILHDLENWKQNKHNQ